jgi:1-acyl-sn-glycerol-3-phosphate acyltransferase
MHIYNFLETRLNKKGLRSAHIVLMNLIAIPLTITWTIIGMILFPFAFFFMKYIQRHSTSFLTRKCIWIYGRVWQFLLSTFVIFTFQKNHGQPFKNPGIIVVNHRSFFDTYCMNMMPISDVCFAVRAWPFKMPLYKIFMKMAGYLNVEKFSWENSIEISKKNIKNNSFILFFPEGHRSKDKNMMHFYSGAFKMAIENNVPVIPICLTGTELLLPPNRYYLTPAKIKMKVLNPIFPDQFTGNMRHVTFKKYVKDQMKYTIKQMDEETI